MLSESIKIRRREIENLELRDLVTFLEKGEENIDYIVHGIRDIIRKAEGIIK